MNSGERNKSRPDGDRTARDEQEARWRAAMVAAQGGDAVAYQKLLEELLPVVRRWVRVRIGDQAMVEDVVQNTLLSVHRARHTYRSERPFSPWLRTIVRNACFDALRERKRRGAREVAVEDPDLFPEPEPTGEAGNEISPELLQALESLPNKQREAVELIQIQGLSVAEAAARAKVSPGALKVRAHRGYRALRARLSERSS